MSSHMVETSDVREAQTSSDRLELQVELCREQLQQYRVHISEMAEQLRAMERVVLEYQGLTEDNEQSGLAMTSSVDLHNPETPGVSISTSLQKPDEVRFPASSSLEGSIHSAEVSKPPSSSKKEFPLHIHPQSDRKAKSDDNVSDSEDSVESVDAEVESDVLKRQTLAKAPDKMYAGTCVIHLCKVYIASGGSCKIREYDPTTMKWNQLPDCPRCDFSLAIINGLLTAIGGWEGDTTTNTLVSFFVDSTGSLLPEKSTFWEEHFPPMPTRRVYTASASYRHYVIVAGGQGGFENKPLTNVEVFNSVNLQWYTASSLPFPVRGSTLAICEDTLYTLGGWDSGDSVLACTMGKFLETLKLEKSVHLQDSFQDPVKIPKPSNRCFCTWHNNIKAPLTQSTCVSLGGHLVTIGGRGDRNEASDNVFEFDSDRGVWIKVGELVGPCYRCLAARVSTGVVLVVGGLFNGYATDCLTVFQ